MIKKRNAITVELTDAQKRTLGELPAHRILGQLDIGTVIISFTHLEAARMIVDINGKVQNYEQYLSFLDKPPTLLK